MYSIINGELVKNNDAKILVTDLSIQRGYGVFDFFKIINQQPFYLTDHLERLFRSAEAMRLTGTVTQTELEQMILQLIEKNQFANAGMRITITGGYAEDGYSIATPNLLITQSPLVVNKTMANGLKLITHEYQRQLPHVKTIDYLQAIYLQSYIKEQGADDVLYHSNDEITECPRSNFFVVTKDDVIITPAKNILAGITRKRILALKQFNVQERAIALKDLDAIKEAFVSSTTKVVMPVLSIDGKQVNDGLPGKITAQIFEALVADH